MCAQHQQADLFGPPPRRTTANETDALAAKELILQRRNHPAWLLLASPRAPLVLGCLQPLFEGSDGEIPIDDARTELGKLLASHANDPDFKIEAEDYTALARTEIRNWITKGLLAERAGMLFATDALQAAFRFIESIQERIMTSTASRLATVQLRIENLENRMDPEKKSRRNHLQSKIAELQRELEAVERGEFEVLSGEQAHEEIREVYNLAMSLRADFRRVEDSYRKADRELRQSIIREEHNRGEIVERLLATNDALIKTPEGQVFSNFYDQIARSNELDKMRLRLRKLLSMDDCAQALTQQQANDLRGLISRLLRESVSIMNARARSEKDVRGFIKTGLAGEHHRVGKLLDELFETVLQIDWSLQRVRRAPVPLAPVAPAQGHIPTPERLIFKSLDDESDTIPNLEQQAGNLDALTDSYAQHCRDLDRAVLYRESLDWLEAQDSPQSIAQLAQALPPEYDLESLSYWVTLAREAGLEFSSDTEQIELHDAADQRRTRFELPIVQLQAEALRSIDHESLE